MRTVALLLAGLLLVSAGMTAPAEGAGATVVRAFFGTDRARDKPDDPDRFYGGARGAPEQGLVQVAVPQDKGRTRLLGIEPLDSGDFAAALREAVDASPSSQLLVFIHGYNRSFSQVARLTAEFSHNVRFPGVPVFWTWPSLRNPATYVEDQNNMRWTRPHLADFLRLLLEESGADTVHLLGHSMGSEVLVNTVLEDLPRMGVDIDRIGEFVLLAPDIDGDIFQRDMAPKLVASNLDVTLYTAANDRAMASSRAVNGYPRAGDSSDGPLIIEGVETVDATEANRSILGHSYFEESSAVMRDLDELLNQGKAARERSRLVPVANYEGRFWRLNAMP